MQGQGNSFIFCFDEAHDMHLFRCLDSQFEVEHDPLNIVKFGRFDDHDYLHCLQIQSGHNKLPKVVSHFSASEPSSYETP